MGWPSNHPQGPYFVRKLIFHDTLDCPLPSGPKDPWQLITKFRLDRLAVMPKRVVAHAVRNEVQALVAVLLKPHAFKILSQL